MEQSQGKNSRKWEETGASRLVLREIAERRDKEMRAEARKLKSESPELEP